MVRSQHSRWCNQVRIPSRDFIRSILSTRHRTLVNAFPEAGLGVAIAADGVVYQSDVYAASHPHVGSPRRHVRSSWGSQAVLVLIGIRLGIDGVNPIYYEPIKVSAVLSIPNCDLNQFSAGTLYIPSIRRHRGRAPLVFVLLYGRSG